MEEYTDTEYLTKIHILNLYTSLELERLKISKQIVNDSLCRTKQQKKQKNIIFRNNINDGYKSKSVLGLF